jgi:hypothetical protein
MSVLVRGHLDMSERARINELSKVLRLIGLPGEKTHDLRGHHTQVQGQFKGVPCKMVCMLNPSTGEPEMMRSVSLIFPLETRTSLELKLQNTVSVRLGLAVTQDRADAVAQAQQVDQRLLPAAEVSELIGLGVPFVLTLLEDRLTMTVYGVFQAAFYESILEFLYRIRQRVVELS